MYKPKTELHTHLFEILPSKEYLIFLSAYNLTIPLDDNYKIVDSPYSREYTVEQVLSNPIIFESVNKQLSFEKGKVYTFNNLGTQNANRNILFCRCINNLVNENGSSYDDNKTFILFSLLKESIRYLRSQGISYSEITYSNGRNIANMEDYIIDDAEMASSCFNILVGSMRSKSVKETRQNVRAFSKIIELPYVGGFDFIGREDAIVGLEAEKMNKRIAEVYKTFREFEKKYVFRIHSGETNDPCARYNTTRVLRIIESESLFDELPFELRIGHGINIDMTLELSILLRKLKPIIEFNITSNRTLGYITDIELYKRVLDFYIDNDVPVVLSSDGTGMFSTTPSEEYEEAEQILGDRIGYIASCDQMMLKKKVSHNG